MQESDTTQWSEVKVGMRKMERAAGEKLILERYMACISLYGRDFQKVISLSTETLECHLFPMVMQTLPCPKFNIAKVWGEMLASSNVTINPGQSQFMHVVPR